METSTEIARKLGAGIYGRLEFDFACNRGHAFSEMHMHGTMVEVLAANISARETSIEPSCAVACLQSSGAAGRKREVDFALVDRSTGSLQLCIESKWSNSSHATQETILRDLARLALIHQESPKTACLFVLAGPGWSVESLMNKSLFQPSTDKKPQQLLKYPYGSGGDNTCSLINTGTSNALLSSNQQVALRRHLPSLPAKIRTRLYKPSHAEPPKWQVHVWRVWSH